MKKRNLTDRALAFYGRLVLSTVLGVFMWVSVSVIASALIPEGEKLTFAGNLVMNIVALVIQGFLYGTIVCSEAWRHGDRDGAQDLFKKETGDAHFGLKVALVASIPALLAYVLLIVDKLVGLWKPYVLLYRLVNGSLYPLIVWTMGFTLDRPITDIPWSGVLLSVLPTLITLALAWVSYYLGYKQVPLMKKLMYSDRPARK